VFSVLQPTAAGALQTSENIYNYAGELEGWFITIVGKGKNNKGFAGYGEL
jgi:hypothetical protein